MERIQLPRGEWFFDPSKPIGKPGGFGAVFEGQSEMHGELAVKRLHLHANDAAHREMRIANDLAGRELQFVIPVLDAGEDASTGSYFVVMPRAQQSLQDALDKAGTFDDLETADTLLAIVRGLEELPDIVHRDLKPANILSQQARWKIADFGIARFVEETTSLRTLKECLSPQYAAPEQWQYFRATSATDIYALGCIGYALLSGRPPFAGRTPGELFEKHLNSDPPSLDHVRPQLQTLLTMMMRKIPESRPSRERVLEILEKIVARGRDDSSLAGAYRDLGAASADAAQAAATAERQATAALSEGQHRKKLAGKCLSILGLAVEELIAQILDIAPVAERRKGSAGYVVNYGVTLGKAKLEVSVGEWAKGTYISGGRIFPKGAFARSGWDVVRGESIHVQQIDPEYLWGASLWYAQLPRSQQYRWYEASYFAPLKREPDLFVPYDLTSRVRDADLAAAPITHLYHLAWGPQPIDDENVDEFCERWAAIFARAAQGQLSHPRGLPLSPEFWRGPF